METPEASKDSVSEELWKTELKVLLLVLAVVVVGWAAIHGMEWLAGAGARWFTRVMNATGNLSIVDSSVLGAVAALAWQVLWELVGALAKIPGATLRWWRTR